MCFCCCSTRQTINTFLLIITTSIFIYSAIVISKHASNTLLYEAFENKLDSVKLTTARTTSKSKNEDEDNDEYDDKNNQYSNRRRISSNDDELEAYIKLHYAKYVSAAKDINSYYYISNLNYYDLEGKSYNVLKLLGGIETGFGATFIVSLILFYLFIFTFLGFSCGNKEYTLSSESTFNCLTCLKTICITLSILLIFLSLAYSTLLSVAMTQYLQFIENAKVDTFLERLAIGIVFGLYGFYYYITLSCGFCAEKNLYLQLGFEGMPGKFAKYYSDGTPIEIQSHNPAPSSQNIVIYHGRNEGIEVPPLSKDPIKVEELVQIETSTRRNRKNKSAINADDNQQLIVLSTSKDGKYLYYNGETYMKMTTTISPPTD